jgi:hypothetical protein
MWYRCEGTNQSASVARVWPGQPQGVVFRVRLAQVPLIDDHCTGSTTNKSLFTVGSSAPLYLSLVEKLPLRHARDPTCRRRQRESCFTLPLHKTELIPSSRTLSRSWYSLSCSVNLLMLHPDCSFPCSQQPTWERRIWFHTAYYCKTHLNIILPFMPASL